MFRKHSLALDAVLAKIHVMSTHHKFNSQKRNTVAAFYSTPGEMYSNAHKIRQENNLN